MAIPVRTIGVADQAERSPLVLSVLKALSLLETMAGKPDGLTLAELSKHNELHPSTAHRLLHTMLEAGYVRQEPRTRRYHLGSRVFRLASPARQRSDIEMLALPHVRALAEAVEETANWAVLEGTEVVYVSQAESPKSLRMLTLLGTRWPAHATASGKALLAYWPADEQSELLRQLSLHAQTPNTITEIDDLLVDLDRIRRRGYAVDDEEQAVGMRSIAAVVVDGAGMPLGAVSIAGPSGRLNVHRLTDVGSQVQATAAAIAKEVG